MTADNGGEWVTVATAAEVAPGSMKAIEANDRQLALYNLGGAFYATDNECTHAYAMLTDGAIDGELVECPLHGGAFDIKTGKGQGAPIFCDIKTYPTRVVGSEVQIQID